MNGLEKDEVLHRTKGMSTEEQELIVRLIPDKLLWEELHRRYTVQNTMLKKVKEVIREGTEK